MSAVPETYESVEELVADLTKWIESDLWDSLLSMNLWREIFDSWRDVVRTAVDGDVTINGYLIEWVRRNYGSYITMAIRRETDRGMPNREAPRSLRLFLGTIKENSELLDREWFMSRTDENPALFPGIEEQWSEIATPDGHHINPDVVQSDIDLIWCVGEDIAAWAKSNVAHALPSGPSTPAPTYSDVEDAIATLLCVWSEWHASILGISVGSLPPVYWEHSMAEAWITEEEAGKIAQRRRPGERPR